MLDLKTLTPNPNMSIEKYSDYLMYVYKCIIVNM